MNLLERYKSYIKKENLFQSKDRLLLAVSGGIDSVVLCELCKQGGYDFAIAHCNFQLRGNDSELDAQFVKKLAEKYQVTFYQNTFNTKKIAKEAKKSIEETARDLRYTWFEEIRNANSHQYILTAHHADDNIETVIMNFFRGTGIKGLRGILPKHHKIIRPLLFARRDEIGVFFENNNLEFVSDYTNLRDDFTRNYFRNKFIPFIERYFPEADENILKNILRFREVEQLYQQSIQLHKKKLLEQKGEEFHIPVLKLQKAEPLSTIVYEMIKDFGFTSHQTNDAIALLQSESGKYIQSSTHRIIKNRNWLIISPNQTQLAQNILIEEKDKQIDFSGGLLELKKIFNIQYSISNNQLEAQLDADEIKFPLLLRKWKQGDYFYPLGMNKKKKLSRFFIDQKLSLTEKENIWVIETNKKIIWVVGMRIDNRFKITTAIKNILQINLSVTK